MTPGNPRLVLGSMITNRLVASQTGGAITIVEISGEAGTMVPTHTHVHEDETFHVLEGEVEFGRGDEQLVAGPGTSVFGPRGIPHSLKMLTPGRVLVILTPGGLEAMFDELAKLPAGPPDMEAVGAVCGRYGISF